MSRINGFFSAFLLAGLVTLALAAVPAQAQQGPVGYKAPDGRVSTYQMFCIGDCYSEIDVKIYTTAGRRVITFKQNSRSYNGVLAVLGRPTEYPILTDADGVVTGITVTGHVRWSTNPDKQYPFFHHTSASQFYTEEHEGNLVGVADTLEAGYVKIYVNITAPEPGSGS